MRGEESLYRQPLTTDWILLAQVQAREVDLLLVMNTYPPQAATIHP